MSAKSTPTSVVMPPGGEASTQVAQRSGLLRDGRYPSGRTNRPPRPANGAPQIPQRGLDGSARSTLPTVLAIEPELIAK